MDQEKIWQHFSALPPEAQQQAADFILFLQWRYPPSPPPKEKKRTRLSRDPFVGMWKDRQDMQDSSAWVRQARQQEWTKPRV